MSQAACLCCTAIKYFSVTLYWQREVCPVLAKTFMLDTSVENLPARLCAPAAGPTGVHSCLIAGQHRGRQHSADVLPWSFLCNYLLVYIPFS